VVLAVAGVVFALATVQRRRWLPAWLGRRSLWPLAALMVLRAVLAAAGDVQQLCDWCGDRHDCVGSDLVVAVVPDMGLLWAATALTYARRARQPGLR
jgi:hypothetical protein